MIWMYVYILYLIVRLEEDGKGEESLQNNWNLTKMSV
jgi:hypothetical protein